MNACPARGSAWSIIITNFPIPKCFSMPLVLFGHLQAAILNGVFLTYNKDEAGSQKGQYSLWLNAYLPTSNGLPGWFSVC